MDTTSPSLHGATRANNRRWPKFRLKSLLIFIAAMAVPLGWCSWKLQQYRNERWAAAELSKFGGVHVHMLWSEPDLPAVPDSLRMMFGKDFFQHVVDVQLLPAGYGPPGKEKVTNEMLSYLRYFPRLNNLTILNPTITDAGLGHLTTLKSLGYVDLGISNISDVGRAKLREALPGCSIVREKWQFDEAGILWRGSSNGEQSSIYMIPRTH